MGKQTDWRDKYNRHQKTLGDISNEVLIANWFLPEHIEHFLGREITEQEYLTIVEKWDKWSCYDWISNEISEWVNDMEAELFAKEGED